MNLDKKSMKFKTYAPLTHKDQTTHKLNDDGTLTITGIASTTNEDLEKDIVLDTAIKSMKHQLTNQRKNLHGDHEYGLFSGAIGAINQVLDSDENTLKIKATILSKYASEIHEMLNIGMNLGLSIGGEITDFIERKNNTGGWEIKDINLFEISLTSMPANWDTYGSVTSTGKALTVKSKCVGGACKKLLETKQKEELLETNKMTNQNNQKPTDGEPTEDSQVTEEKVIDLINQAVAPLSEKLNELIDNQNNQTKAKEELEDEEEEKTKACDDEEEEKKPEEKSLTLETLIKAFGAALDAKFGEDPTTAVADKMWDMKKQNRNPTGGKSGKFIETLKKEQDDETNTKAKKTYSPREAAAMSMKRKQMNNPFYQAIKDSIEE